MTEKYNYGRLLSILQSGNSEQRLGEILLMRLEYDEAKSQVDNLQQELISIDEQMVPGQNDSDKDRCDFMLIT